MSRDWQRWKPWRRKASQTFLLAATTLCLFALDASSASALPPTIPLITASQITTDSARLEAEIDPGGKATSYLFEYGLADCVSFPPCIEASKGELLGGGGLKRETAPIAGLAPGTTYHFRVVAENLNGKAEANRTFTTFVIPEPFGPCPNDLLRAGPTGTAPSLELPDCRAYEQASSVDKNGVSLLGDMAPLKASLLGDAISFESLGIPGGEGAQDLPFYLARRGAEDWSTQSLFPHGKTGDDANVSGWTRDFAWSYSTARRATADEEAYFARSSADGSLETIVDYHHARLFPSFAGASEDGSKVFFESRTQILPEVPEAAPEEQNLYVWDRDTDKLSLAGVLPDDTTPDGGSFAGSYDWIRGTDEGTLGEGGSARKYYTQDDHAISEDGKRVFFTAADTGQLYMREDPGKPGATTVNVSASQKTKKDTAGTRPAAFVGATPDGSLAFFTSSEKLTDDATTGPEPTGSPAIAQADIDGDSIDIDFLPVRASGIDLDATHIYWIDPTKEAIFRAKLDGDPESVEEVIPHEIEIEPDIFVPIDPEDLALDAEHIYWTDAEGEGRDEGVIGRAKLGLSGAEEIKPEFIPADFEVYFPPPFGNAFHDTYNPRGIAVNATHIYWGNVGHDESKIGSEGSLMRAQLDGGKIEDWGEYDNDGSGEGEVILPRLFAPLSIALDEDYAYFTEPNSDDIIRQSLSNPEARDFVLTDPQGVPHEGVAIDDTYFYWASWGRNSIGRYKLSDIDSDIAAGEGGEKAEREFIEEAGNPQGLAVDAKHIYWSANQEVQPNPGNDLYRYDTETGDLSDLVVDEADPNGAEVRGVLGISDDGSRLYFAANGDLDGTGPATKGDCQGDPVGGSGSCNLYLWEEGSACCAFIAPLETGGGTNTDALDWAGAEPATGVFSTSFPKTARISADGNILVFRSTEQLTDYQNEGTPHFYRYSAEDKSLECLTCNPTGLAGAAPTLGSINNYPAFGPGSPAALLTRNLSAGGERFFFESTEALVPGDTNGASGCPIFKAGDNLFPSCRDVYMWEAKGSGSCNGEAQNGGCLYLLSTGKSPEPSFFADAGASGEDAFLITSSPGLVGRDQDQLHDVYDVRIEGGLASQSPVKVICTGIDPCRGEEPKPPAMESPPGFSGPPDPKPNHKACPKGKRKAKVKGTSKTRCLPKRRPAKGQRGRRDRGAETIRRAER